jgi:hypothetical protein
MVGVVQWDSKEHTKLSADRKNDHARFMGRGCVRSPKVCAFGFQFEFGSYPVQLA